MYLRIHIDIYILCIYICICTHDYVNIHIHIYAYVYFFILICSCIILHTYSYVCTHTYIYTYIKDPGPWEGEERNMWKPTAVKSLWFHGGNLHQSRHYSLYLSLQLKARFESLDTPVYGIPKVYHKG